MKQNLKNWKHYHPCVFVEHNFLWQLKWHLVLRNFMAVITFPLLLWSWLCWLNILICFRLRLNLTIMVGLIRIRFITTLDDMLGSLQVSLLSSHSLQHLLKTKRSPHSQILIWAGQLSSVIIGPLTLSIYGTKCPNLPVTFLQSHTSIIPLYHVLRSHSSFLIVGFQVFCWKYCKSFCWK